MLKCGLVIDLLVYSYVEYMCMKEMVMVELKKVIILEGILLLMDVCLCDEFNFFIFVDILLDICLMCCIKCDVNECGCLMDLVMV